MYSPRTSCFQRYVALYTSAWIEMKRPSFQEMVAYVALYTSAWIEMSITCMYSSSIGSHSTRVRGLKSEERETFDAHRASHSTRVRGLK